MNPEHTPDAVTVASGLYSSYCAAVGGVAFNGDPLPSWDEFYADPDKQKQAGAWVAVALDVISEQGHQNVERYREIVAMQEERIKDLEDLLVSARAICERKGEDTAWARFSEQIRKRGIGSITPKVFRKLDDDDL